MGKLYYFRTLSVNLKLFQNPKTKSCRSFWVIHHIMEEKGSHSKSQLGVEVTSWSTYNTIWQMERSNLDHEHHLATVSSQVTNSDESGLLGTCSGWLLSQVARLTFFVTSHLSILPITAPHTCPASYCTTAHRRGGKDHFQRTLSSGKEASILRVIVNQDFTRNKKYP